MDFKKLICFPDIVQSRSLAQTPEFWKFGTYNSRQKPYMQTISVIKSYYINFIHKNMSYMPL